MQFIVIAREDLTADGEKGEYSLATREVFTCRKAADAYADGVSRSREPLVVVGRFSELRLP
jgi:hypothetical protein